VREITKHSTGNDLEDRRYKHGGSRDLDKKRGNCPFLPGEEEGTLEK